MLWRKEERAPLTWLRAEEMREMRMNVELYNDSLIGPQLFTIRDVKAMWELEEQLARIDRQFTRSFAAWAAHRRKRLASQQAVTATTAQLASEMQS